MPWFVYILLCDKKTYYVGLSHDVRKRVSSHRTKRNIATKKFSYIELIYTEEYETRREAQLREKQLKKWSIAKKKALVSGDIKYLKQLSKTRSVSKDRLE